jgi:hypothetical protein
MALPKKKSRLILVDDVKYRWMVSFHHGSLHLTVESEEVSGQTLVAHFDSHDQFKRQGSKSWTFERQGRSITPDNVIRIIRHGLANGWEPFFDW